MKTDTLAFRIKEMMLAYPSIFPNEDACINHLYLVIGNGYDWVNGALVSSGEDKKSKVRDMIIDGVPEQKIKAWVKKQDDKRHKEMFENDETWKALQKLTKKYDIKLKEELKALHREELLHEIKAYPICEYSAIWDITADAKPDWVAGAYRAAVFAVTHDSYDKRATRENHMWVAKAVVRLDKMFGHSNRPSRKD